jgi:hypothetical protein
LKLLIAVSFVVLRTPAWSQSFEAPPPANVFEPITASARAEWALKSTFGPIQMLTIPLESALQTWANSPKEYGPHWDGYGRRMASKFGTAAVSNTMEASIGSLWGEDPRYHRLGEGSKGERFKHSFKMAFFADRQSGGVMPAYARFIAIPSSRLISDTWRQPSELSPGGDAQRIGLAFVRRIAGNTFNEFWPDLRRRLFRRDNSAKTQQD